MKKNSKIAAVYPGSFDPITNGHLDIIERATKLFGNIMVAVSENYQKRGTLSVPERKNLIELALETRGLKSRVQVDSFDGLLVDYLKRCGSRIVIRGLRFVSDFENEFQMALLNRHLDPGMETVFLMPDEKNTYLSSSIVREIAHLGGDVSIFVPPGASKAFQKKFTKTKHRK